MKDDTLAALLERAAHETTPLPEAVNALQAAKRRLAAVGRSLQDLSISESSGPARPEQLFSGTLRAELDRLRQLTSAQDRELNDARREIASLHRKLERARPRRTRDDGSMSWQHFSEAAMSRIGKTHGWKRIFARQFGLSSEALMGTWAAADQVPHTAVTFLAELKPEAKRRAPTGQPWTDYEHQRLREVLSSGKGEVEAAKMLEAEFGRTITLGSIKKARQRLRTGRNGASESQAQPA